MTEPGSPEEAGQVSIEPGSPEEAGQVSIEPGRPEEPGHVSIEPGMPGNPVKLTDPQMMRALAHQARIAIWTHLGMHGPATATECAEIAGLSPSACSYHLRTLASYGFVEEDRASAADGRERPWRARLLAFSMGDSPDAPAATQVASRLLVENMRASAEEIRAAVPGPQVGVSRRLAGRGGRGVQRGARDAG